MWNLIPHRTCIHTAVLPVSTDGQTDRQTDELIWGGLGNLRFLQVNRYQYSKTYCSYVHLIQILRDLHSGEMSVKFFARQKKNLNLLRNPLHGTSFNLNQHMLCSSLTRSHCLFIFIHPHLSHIAVVAVVTAGWLLYLGCQSIRLFTMSQSRLLQEEYSKKYRKAANNAAINLAITDLVAARNVRHTAWKDKAMPKDLIGWRERCVEWITRPSPTASPNQSDTEDNDAANAEEGLLGMAAIRGISPDMLERNGVEGGVNEDDDEYGWWKYIKMFDA